MEFKEQKDNVETLTEVETDRQYNEKTVEGIHVNIDKNKIVCKCSDDNIKQLCNFQKFINSDISEIVKSKDLIISESMRQELSVLKRDLIELWNNTGNNMYSVEYDKSELPYKLVIPFQSNLIGEVIVQETHNESGDFIADNIKNQMNKPLYKLETMNNIYAKKSQSRYTDWELYEINKLNFFNSTRIKKENKKDKYYNKSLRILNILTIELLLLQLFFTINIALTLGYIGIGIPFWLIIISVFMLMPPWKQNIVFYHYMRFLMSKIYIFIKALIKNYYSKEKLFNT